MDREGKNCPGPAFNLRERHRGQMQGHGRGKAASYAGMATVLPHSCRKVGRCRRLEIENAKYCAGRELISTTEPAIWYRWLTRVQTENKRRFP